MINPTTLIIGANSSIGLVLASHYLENGETVLLHHRGDGSSLTALSDKFPNRAVLLKADLSSTSEIESLLYEVKKSDCDLRRIAFCASPKAVQERIKKIQWQDFEKQIEVNVKSTFLILQNLLPELGKKNWSRILYVTTSYTIGMPPSFISPYVSAKFMLNGMMKALASEYAAKGVTINGIAPSMMNSPFLNDLPEFVTESAKANHPLKRLAEASEMLPVMTSLLDEKSSYTNGIIVPMTGGTVVF